LRAHVASDFDALAAQWADPAVVLHIGGIHTREQSWARLLRFTGHWHLLGYGTFAAVERATNRYVGSLGISSFERDLDPAAYAALATHEAGWVLASEAQGKGYAAEGMRAALAWHEAAFPGVATGCMVDVDNAGSIRIAEKLGYREVHRTHYRTPIVIFRR